MKLIQIIIESDGVTIAQIRKKWTDSEFGPSDPFTINNGWCSEFAMYLKAWHPDLTFWSDYPEHAFVQINGKLYDAETENGVKNWQQLHYYQDHMLIKNRTPNPQPVSFEKFCEIWGYNVQDAIEMNKKIIQN